MTGRRGPWQERWASLAGSGRPSTAAQRWWATTAVLLAVAAGLFTAGLDNPESSLADSTAVALQRPNPDPSRADPTDVALLPVPNTGPSLADSATVAPSPAAKGAAAARLPVAAPRLARSAPVELRIPAIKLAVPVSELGLNADRTVQVPTDFSRPGWFRLGPSPGQAGSAVILGHVDSYRGPAVFFDLRSLRPGDVIEVDLVDGTVARFAVTGIAMYPKVEFPGQRVYAAAGGPTLNLVTCGGEFDRNTRSYLSNLVVSSALVGTTPPVVGN